MNITRCLAVMDRADEMAVKLYEQALDIAYSSDRMPSEEFAVLLEDSADVIRELAGALRVAAVIVLQKAEAHEAAAAHDEQGDIAR